MVVCSLVLFVGWLCLPHAPQAAADEAPITEDDRQHWSFQSLTRPQIPDVENTNWPNNAIDRFILARLEAEGLQSMPQADRATLIRRVTYDLTGLPPLPADVDAFVSDVSPDAYERLVDRLLHSPAYGERWAQHWLDLARFAETDGFEHDKIRPNAWRYRDWVIDALNGDLRADDFVAWQLAGDELRPDDPQAAVATGFLLCGPDMPDINLQEERRHVFLNDMTSIVGSVFLAMQMGCAQCHDHKYDPISQRDFYRLRSFFENADIFRDHPIPTAEQQARKQQAELERAQRWNALKAQISALEGKVFERIRQQQDDPGLRLPKDQVAKQFTQEERTRHAELEAALAEVKKQTLPKLPMGRVLREKTADAPASYLWIRGDFRQRGPEVEPAFLRVANAEGETVADPPRDADTSRRRSELARWLTDPTHPLTTRVLANRLWQWHFGRGLSGTSSDFGLMGDEPTHPELLDWLATELPLRNWSLKSMHRLIVTSATYRQASRPGGVTDNAESVLATWEVLRDEDPYNNLWGRMPRRRLEGEAIRDAMLLAADDLNRKPGGAGVRPPLPNELLATLLKNQWPVTPEVEEHRRRSIYLFVRRNLGYPLFEVFDKPDTNASCPRRERSTIAPQALMLLNSELSLDSARRLAGYVWQHAGNDPHAQIESCYMRTLSRLPTPEERDLGLEFLKQAAARLLAESRSTQELALPIPIPEEVSPQAAAALTDFCLALFNLNEFAYVD